MRVMLLLYCTKLLNTMMLNTQLIDSLDTLTYNISYITSPEEAYASLNSFYFELCNCIQMNAKVSSLIKHVIQYIKLHAVEGIKLEDIGEHFHVSPNYLSALIKKETGMTYQQHLLNAKINIAKKMLDDTRISVEKIAYSVGYKNYISFYNLFRRIEGISPTDYRFRSARSSGDVSF
jgi:two-component system response regulator YesN